MVRVPTQGSSSQFGSYSRVLWPEVERPQTSLVTEVGEKVELLRLKLHRVRLVSFARESQKRKS